MQKGHLQIRRSVLLWYFSISQTATVPWWYLWSFFSPSFKTFLWGLLACSRPHVATFSPDVDIPPPPPCIPAPMWARMLAIPHSLQPPQVPSLFQFSVGGWCLLWGPWWSPPPPTYPWHHLWSCHLKWCNGWSELVAGFLKLLVVFILTVGSLLRGRGRIGSLRRP